MKVVIGVAMLVAVTSACMDGDATPLVATREGVVRGLVDRSAAGHLFHSFKGMPYARPPLGDLRFRPPQRHPGWSGVRDAAEHGSKCTQFRPRLNGTREGVEDCLFANVYTRRLPEGTGAAGLPVMVFIHGGGFMFGDGDSDFLGPHYLMDEDVVLVTFNYRLGPFGFFTTHDGAAPGNYGLLDQVLLLEWVRDNIAAFGGDPRTVTILGESAGGASVSLLVLSPLARGLFHHAITQSGSALGPYAVSGRRKGLAAQLAAQLNCSCADTTAMVDCVRGVSEDDLRDAADRVGESIDFFFTPRVDAEAARPFLPEDPRALLESGRFSLVPWMNGFTEEEGTLFLPGILANRSLAGALFAGDLTAWGRLSDLGTEAESSILDCGAELSAEVAKVYDFYAKNDTVGPANLLPLAQVLGDRLLGAPGSEEVRLASAHAPVYQYLLDHRGPGRQAYVSLPPQFPDFGPTHADDLAYLFSQRDRGAAAVGTAAYRMVRFLVSLWTSFARTGRPGSDVLPMPDWPVYAATTGRYMRLNSQPSVGERLLEERVRFWQTVAVNEPWRHAVQTSCPADTQS